MNKHTQELAKLITEHPELDVVFMVSSSSDFSDHDYAPQKIERVYIGVTAHYKKYSVFCETKDAVDDEIRGIHAICDDHGPFDRVLGKSEYKDVIIVELEAV